MKPKSLSILILLNCLKVWIRQKNTIAQCQRWSGKTWSLWRFLRASVWLTVTYFGLASSHSVGSRPVCKLLHILVSWLQRFLFSAPITLILPSEQAQVIDRTGVSNTLAQNGQQASWVSCRQLLSHHWALTRHTCIRPCSLLLPLAGLCHPHWLPSVLPLHFD